MSLAEGVAVWAAVAGYAAGFAALVAAGLFGRRWLRRLAAALPLAAMAAHATAILVRWIATGHAPVMRVHENALVGSFFLALIFAPVAWRFPAVRRAAPVVVAGVLLLLGHGLMGGAEELPLEPPFRSNWLVVHVTFAWLAFGSYLVASAVAAQYLWSTRGLRGKLSQADPRALADELAAKLIAFGFVSDSVMIASGAIWAHGLWGRYWAWDPTETWSLVTWLVYGANLHLRFTLGWKGPRAAWAAVLSAIAVLVTFFGLGVVSQVHTQLL